MHRKLAGIVFGIFAFATTATAQTVTGSGTAGTVPVFTGSGTTSTIGTPSSPITVTTTGNVGIGTSAPAYPLDVNGSIQMSMPNQGISLMTLGGALATSGTKGWFIRANSDTTPWNGYPDSLDFEVWNGTSYVSPMTFTASGNVGVGTATNTYGSQLNVGGGITSYAPEANYAAVFVDDQAGGRAFQAVTRDYNYNASGSSFALEFGAVSGNTYAALTASTNGKTTSGNIALNPCTQPNVNCGNVGIGTTSPTSLFSVGSSSQFQVNASGAISSSGGLAVSGGAVSFPSFSIANSALQGSGVLTVAAGSGLSGGGAVALGGAATLSLPNIGTPGTYGSSTQVPVFTTDAFGRVTGVTTASITSGSSSWSALATPSANLALSTGTYTTTFTAGSATGTANLFSFTDSASNNGTGNLVNISTATGSTEIPLAVSTAGGSTPSFEVAANGSVGIGTTSPRAKLEVNGGLRFTGDPNGTVQTTAWTGVLCGGDYAEAVNASGGKKSYEPGDVLELSSDEKGDVHKSQEPYSTLVAGIYATKPGVIGRRQNLLRDSDEVPMAMVGIVPTKVSAENGPIHKGDLLVSSSTPGFAMKGTDRGRMLGAVIGKAMGSLDKGNGIIEVLVTLQ